MMVAIRRDPSPATSTAIDTASGVTMASVRGLDIWLGGPTLRLRGSGLVHHEVWARVEAARTGHGPGGARAGAAPPQRDQGDRSALPPGLGPSGRGPHAIPGPEAHGLPERRRGPGPPPPLLGERAVDP